jgi:hypothetical protein
MKALIAGVALGSAILAGSASAQTLEVVGVAGEARVLALPDLRGLVAVEVSVDEGGPTTYQGPALRQLAALAGAPTGRALRGPAMALAILAEGADGYAVVFTVAELDEQFGGRQAIIATSRNGDAIVGDDGPLRLVVPEDAFHARWVRGLMRLRLIDLSTGRGATPAH